MALPVLKKYPGEERPATFDFTDKLEAGDSLTGTATVTTSPGLTLGTPVRSGNVVTVEVLGGTLGNDYTLACTCGTVDGYTLEIRLTMEVRADAN